LESWIKTICPVRARIIERVLFSCVRGSVEALLSNVMARDGITARGAVLLSASPSLRRGERGRWSV